MNDQPVIAVIRKWYEGQDQEDIQEYTSIALRGYADVFDVLNGHYDQSILERAVTFVTAQLQHTQLCWYLDLETETEPESVKWIKEQIHNLWTDLQTLHYWHGI